LSVTIDFSNPPLAMKTKKESVRVLFLFSYRRGY
jgi:hypothetical protein